MKHYLFVIPTLSGGGAERVVSVLASELSKSAKVTVLAYFRARQEYPRDEKVQVVYLADGEADYNGMDYYHRLGGIRRIVKQANPDYVIPFLFQVCMQVRVALLGTRYPVLQTVRNDPAALPASPLVRKLRDAFICFSCRTIVQNNQQKEYFPRFLHRKIHVMFNPVSDDLLAARWTPREKPFLVCGVGRLNKQKNFPLLMDAFAKAFRDTPDAVLHIYGHGDEMEHLTAHAAQTGMGDRIRLMGRCNQMKAVYENASLYVLSSNFEGMPNVLIEAMAVGVPSISTDCPTGPSDLIDNEKNGLLVPMNDADAMAAAMRSIYDRQHDVQNMSAAAKATIRRLCSAEQIAQQLVRICDTIR